MGEEREEKDTKGRLKLPHFTVELAVLGGRGTSRGGRVGGRTTMGFIGSNQKWGKATLSTEDEQHKVGQDVKGHRVC